LLAAESLPRFFPMLTTAAGTIPPAKVLVIGAGVAGLQAIATARRLGAVVSAYDTRAVVKEQIQSLGAKFLQFDLGVDAQAAGGYAKELTPEQTARQRELMKNAIAASDAVITTAAVPGRRAPVIITADAVAAMETANSPSPARRSSPRTASRSWAPSISPPPSPRTRANSTRATCRRCSTT
jgi:NAD(P) transhydrogenase subunit alpha